jgi:hypothetical protein
MRACVCGVLLFVAGMVASAGAQTTDEYSRKNTFTLFAEGSAPSTPVIVGEARRRLIFDAGGAYTRRVVRFWGSDLGYHIELRPVLFESDPFGTSTTVSVVTSGPTTGTVYTFTTSGTDNGCTASTFSGTLSAEPPYIPSETYTVTNICGRRWTFGQSFAPIGFKYSMRTRHRLQPFLVGTLGYMYTSRPVPVEDAESFNFVINVGVGVEVYSAGKRSISFETRIQHFSNRYTAPANPGTDNLMFKASYSFGR